MNELGWASENWASETDSITEPAVHSLRLRIKGPGSSVNLIVSGRPHTNCTMFSCHSYLLSWFSLATHPDELPGVPLHGAFRRVRGTIS